MPVFDITLPPLRKPTKPNKVINVIGRKFTRLTPLGLLGIEGEKRESRAIWLCRCDCGNLLAIASHNLLQNICKSCGCLKRELDRTRCLTHGMSHTPVFYIWQGVISRCERPKNESFASYGGRGIKICDGWHDFKTFYHDIGARPTPIHSLDRINNDGDYSCGHCEQCVENGWPMNVRWATRMEQAANTRRNVLLTANGETHHMAEWSRIRGIGYGTLQARIRRGNSHSKALGFKERSV